MLYIVGWADVVLAAHFTMLQELRPDLFKLVFGHSLLGAHVQGMPLQVFNHGKITLKSYQLACFFPTTVNF